MDLIGAMAPTDNFVVCGNNEESLFGVCESMYKPDLEPEELFEVIAQCIRGREPGLPLGMGRRGARDLQGQGHHAHAEGPHGLSSARQRKGGH